MSTAATDAQPSGLERGARPQVQPAGQSLVQANAIVVLSSAAIVSHLLLRFTFEAGVRVAHVPLLIALTFGGVPLVVGLVKKLLQREFGSDLLAGISIVTSVILGEYLAGSIVVLMLAGGEALEAYAIGQASSVLQALARRMPSIAHRKGSSGLIDVPLDEITIGDILSVYPHEICPVDGVVMEGHGEMDESFLTGEPFEMLKAPGSMVLSGAINSESALTIRATKRAVDSRYARIMQVMRESEQNRPRLRRLGDQLGALYTPLAVGLALAAWARSGEPLRFLAVLVVATPCPLLIGIPVAIVGAISLSARRAIIVKNPAVLEQIGQCRVALFDKTGTLTYGAPKLTDQVVAPGRTPQDVLMLAASLERYSKHPLGRAIVAAASQQGLALADVAELSEPPGQGLRGVVRGHHVRITSRTMLQKETIAGAERLPAFEGGLECVVVIDDEYAATFRFRDAPRAETRPFVRHLGPRHGFERVLIVSGDRESEVRYLADQVGVAEIHASMTPEEKLALVRRETSHARTLYVGDGINDAPAMMAATVGMAIGENSDVTAEAADVVAMENSLGKIDEFIHIGRRMRGVALQSAIGGMVLSVGGMILAAAGLLTPVAGALSQEVIDVLSVLNALRAALPPKVLSDWAPANAESSPVPVKIAHGLSRT